ncbi:MAG: hypothetical protein ABFC63_07415 [Thermoguttaceae bacterium]
MKREERHRLQHNALADWLAKALNDVKPYQNAVYSAIVVVALAVAGYAWVSHSAQAKTADAWDRVTIGLQTGNLADFTQVIDDFPNTPVGDMATVICADLRLAEGCSRLLLDKAVALQHLGRALELYGRGKEAGNPAMRERATYGQARAWEAQGRPSDLDAAKRCYQEVVTNWPEGAYAAFAKQRLTDLQRPTTKQLYDDLSRYAPKAVQSPSDALPGEPPTFSPDGLPREPAAGKDIKFEELGGKTGEQSKKAETPKKSGADKPKEPSKKK